jgi:hypothetical protein
VTPAEFLARRVLSAICASAIIMLTPPAPAFAQDDAFRAGLDARADKKWREVTVQMRRAIQANPQESTRKVRSRLGGLLRQGGTEYLPHFFLGEALFSLEDCVGAMDAWSISERQGAVQSRTDLVVILRDGYATCEAKGVLPPTKYDPLVARTTQHITEVNSQAAAVVKVGTANIELWQADARQQYDRASSEIQSARTSLEAAIKTRAQLDFNAANSAADRAKNILVALEATLNAAIGARLTVQRDARDIEQMLGAADGLDRLLESKKAQLTTSLANTRGEGRDALSRARERLTAGAKASSASILGEARAFAVEASAKFKRVLDEVTSLEREALGKRLADATDEAQRTFVSMDDALARLDRLTLARPAVLQPDAVAEREAVQRDIATVRRRFDAARRTENLPSILEVNRLTREAANRLNRLISLFGPIPITERGVHPALLEGARLFFAGDYQKAISALNPPEGFGADVPLQVHIHLFRAAALYALFVRSHETDAALRAQALGEVEQCHRMAPGLQPDPRAFAPSFIRFFQTRSAIGSPPQSGNAAAK